MLGIEPAALVLFDGIIGGWFTGVGLPTFFNASTAGPYNARKTVNGLDRADLIEGYHRSFMEALT
jgi:putative chitinase